MKRLLLTSAVLLALVAPAAAMIVELPLDKITRESAHVLRGTVIDTEAAWTPDGSTIVTQVTLRIDERWKGDLSKDSTVNVLVRGGEVGPIGIRVEHQPRFIPTEQVLVFLEPTETGALRVFGDEQGKFTVVDRHIVNTIHAPVLLKDFQAEVQRHIPREDNR